MKKIKWYYLLAFAMGGLMILAVAYLLLRASGIIYKLSSEKNKWVEYE